MEAKTEIKSKLARLQNLFDPGKVNKGDLPEMKTILTELKLLVIKMPSCIPTESASNLDVEEMFLARSVYECAAVYAIYADDGQLFESNANNLFTYYGDMREVLPPSEHEALVWGLLLTHLLASDQLGDFYLQLCRVPPAVSKHPLVLYPISLEIAVMDGNHKKVILQAANPPNSLFGYFSSQLLVTVRERVALAMAASYASVTVEAARELLGLKTTEEVLVFAKDRNEQNIDDENEPKWRVTGDRISFVACANEKKGLNPSGVLEKMLEYATELERIV
eukprot:GHVU01138681.1.p1 GENE.GHVU01138681.1~~GHVU01138681.1.p1  ORF type:complete len:298 (+),score=52.76 GHVU01138681.1:60-896(+)